MAETSPGVAKRALPPLWEAAAVAALCLGFFLAGLSAVWHKSPAFDEIAHLTGGYSYWATNDYRLHSENGDWPQRLAALPAWLLGYAFPPLDQQCWWESLVWQVGDQFFYGCGNDADRMLRWGRGMIGLSAVALGLVVYAWSRRLFGAGAGLLSLALYACSPTMLAHGFLTTSDLAAGLFFTTSTWALWAMLHRVRPLSVSLSCLAMSGLFLSKMSAVLIVPMGLSMVAVRLWHGTPLPAAWRGPREIRGRGRQAAVIAALAVVHVLVVAAAIWASFGFRYASFNEFEPGRDQLMPPWDLLLGKIGAAGRVIGVARDWRLLPQPYLYGFTFMLFGSQARNAYLMGEFSRQGWHTFFPIAAALKTPLSLAALLAAAGAVGYVRLRTLPGSQRGQRSPSGLRRLAAALYPLTPLLVLLGVYWAFSIASHLNIGHRHILPTYPALFILAGAAALWFEQVPAPGRTAGQARKRTSSADAAWPSLRALRVWRGCVVAAALVAVIEAAWTWPNYLAYFNPLVGGTKHAYRWLVDSSLDWGQELPALKDWLDENHRPSVGAAERPVYLSYFGSARPAYYGIQFQALPMFHDRFEPHVPQPLASGTYAISATMLPGVYLQFPGRWNSTYEAAYQELSRLVDQYRRAESEPARMEQLLRDRPQAVWWQVFHQYEELRFARLCSFLRQREPDAQIGYSILIYELDEEALRRAVEGPPIELLALPESSPARRPGAAR